MSSLRKICLLLWKNWIYRKHHFVITALEIIFPTLLSGLAYYLFTYADQFLAVSYESNATIHEEKTINNCGLYFDGSFSLFYWPRNNFTEEAMANIQKVFDNDSLGKEITIEAVSSEKEMEEKAALLKQDSRLWGGIIFDDLFISDKPSKSLHVRFRPTENRWLTDMLIPNKIQWGQYNSYEVRCFHLIQHQIALNYIKAVTTIDLTNSVEIYMQEFPYPPHYKDRGVSDFLEAIIPFTVILSYIFISPTLIKRIVYEKELGIKELMKLMGLPGWIQWLCWFITSFIMMTISAVIIVIFFTMKTENDLSILNKTAPELLLLVLVLYIAASIAFCLFISSMFSKPNLASVVGILLWLLSYYVPYYVWLVPKYRSLNFSQKMSLAFLPNMALSLALRVIGGFESRNIGLQWNVLTLPGYREDNITMLNVLLMMIIDVLLYSFLTWYIDNTFPGKYGIKKPWYFLFTKSYWKRPVPSEEEVSAELIQEINNFESEPVGLTPIIVIKNLSKEFISNTWVVDNVNLNIYSNQITALLGHNGAGKTTTMSILTGLFPPTSGTALINGFDIRKDIDSARQNIGLCPQHNIYFEGLTVHEHLLFFGKLKGLSGVNLDNEISSLLNKLDMWKKRDDYPLNLSGGMKRKLNLAISLIGGPSVVILDEPTSGMDPEARRAVWDLLGELRSDKSILLTTHSMEEADVLADRIAIMAHGKIHCCGSSAFLKKKYGTGYHLNVSKDEKFQKTEFVLLLHRHCPTSSVTSENNNDITFLLPSEDMSYFPPLLDDLDSKGKEMGVRNFGLSLTTMEEVFLKVGEIVDTEMSQLDKDVVVSTDVLNEEIQTLNYNSGLSLYIQQFRALIMKRIHYSRRRWLLIIAQIIIPVFGFILSMLLYNQYESRVAIVDNPSRFMDIRQYDKTLSIESHTEDTKLLAQSYAAIFPENALVKSYFNTTEYYLNLGKNDLRSYVEEHIIGAEFSSDNSIISIVALYNGLYIHSLPLSLNMIYNALLRNLTGINDWKIIVENHPLPSQFSYWKKEQITLEWFFGGIVSTIGLVLLTASFVIFPIHERVSSCAHLQLMTGTNGILFWGASFLWDLTINIVSALLCIIIIVIMDKTNLLRGVYITGAIFLSLLLNGCAAIPFSYVLSFITTSSATGFNVLSSISLLACIVFTSIFYSLHAMRGLSDNLFNLSQTLKWIFRLIPSYPISIALINIPQVSLKNNECKPFEDKLENYCNLQGKAKITAVLEKCCLEICKDDCFEEVNMYSTDSPGILEELLMLMFDCFLYFFIIFILQNKFVQIIISRFLLFWKLQRNKSPPDLELQLQLDEDVKEENDRIKSVINSGTISEDALIVYDLTKHFWKLTAVDHLNFGVESGECFGLLGVNGAGKTTTFRMLTGDALISKGNAYLKYVSLAQQPSKFLSHVGYCPQADPLIDYLTGREMLWLFARLRGIDETQIPDEIEKTIVKFDLSRHADKITIKYSGGTKRKLAAAMAFIGHSMSSIILLDEPTTGVDPVARRKLWEIVKNANRIGTSVILTSHSMEECEVLCSRIAIMVNGKFQCLGGTQHLKNKFSNNYTVKIKLPQQNQEVVQEQFQQFMKNKFQECVLKDSHQGLVHYQVEDESISLKKLFIAMEEAKNSFDLQDYSVTQATLEQVFLSFAKQQRPIV